MVGSVNHVCLGCDTEWDCGNVECGVPHKTLCMPCAFKKYDKERREREECELDG